MYEYGFLKKNHKTISYSKYEINSFISAYKTSPRCMGIFEQSKLLIFSLNISQINGLLDYKMKSLEGWPQFGQIASDQLGLCCSSLDSANNVKIQHFQLASV